jgi:hypothetical protein
MSYPRGADVRGISTFIVLMPGIFVFGIRLVPVGIPVRWQESVRYDIVGHVPACRCGFAQ